MFPNLRFIFHNYLIDNSQDNKFTATASTINHMKSLNGKTPAEACGIVIEGQNKWKTLIQNASPKKKR